MGPDCACLKTIEDAIEIRRRVLLAFELAERQMLETGSHPPLNFVVIGGGPTGVELAGAISDIAKLYIAARFPPHRSIQISVAVDLKVGRASSAAYPEDLSVKAVEQLTDLGVEAAYGNASHRYPAWHIDRRQPASGCCCHSRAAGVAASPLGKLLGFETDRRGCVLVNETLNPPGHPDIFVCGDLAHVEQDGKQVPGVAQPAMQMGAHVAKMIEQDLNRKPRTTFAISIRANMATIGRLAAVAKSSGRSRRTGAVSWPGPPG